MTNPLPASTTQVVFGLGLGLTQSRLDIVDQVSGVVSYQQGATLATAPLANIWFDTDVQCAVSGTPTFLAVAYEEQG
jgi:hypothetical protein